MAAGDTISGQIRVRRIKTLGDEEVVAGPFPHSLIDHKDAHEKGIYINVPMRALPIGASPVYTKKGVFYAGETLQVQHLSASLEEAADYDADEIFISLIEVDKNTGDKLPRMLTVNDTDLSADATTSTSSWVTIFEDVVPDRRIWYLAGSFNVAAVETA